MTNEELEQQLAPAAAQPLSTEGVARAALLHSGSTLLNLACSGLVTGGFPKGRYVFLVGDSGSGKTFLTLTCFAEACRNPMFDGYRLIYDGPEGGALMNFREFFGEAAANRIEMPEPSLTVEQFYYNVDDATAAGPCVYVLDSMDVLSSVDDDKKFEDRKEAERKGKTTTGTFGLSKAKANSANLRKVMGSLSKTGSILIIINQTRDNITGYGAAKTRGGGHALTFYAHLEIWTKQVGNITKTVNGTERQLGVMVEAEIRKNRLTGRRRKVVVPIYHSFGIDDLGSCIDFLVEEGRWKKPKGKQVIEATDLQLAYTRDKLIQTIEENGLEEDVFDAVQELWDTIEEQCKIPRKKKYE